jgi:glycosyltransferase involved in cell wall biosynthesis
MRVALVRGSLLRSWELPNYLIEGVRVDPVVSRGLEVGPPAERFHLCRLRSAGDLLARIGPRGRGAVELVAGSPEYLLGLEGALEGYDVAHALELTYPFTWQALRARRRGACRRVVATVMENIPLKPHPNALVAARAREAAAAVDHFIAITERARLHLRLAGVPEERISVIPLGTDTQAFRPGEERAEGPLRILSVARLEPAKGVEDVVIAAGLLLERGRDVELTLVGSGPLEGRLGDIAARLGMKDRLRILAVPWQELPDVYRAHDVFVLGSAPTRWWREQFGFAVIEAMASGLPVLAGASGSLPEVVGRDEALVMPHDPLSLADRLERLAADPGLRSSEGARSRSRAVEHFDQRAIRTRLEALYARVLAEAPA